MIYLQNKTESQAFLVPKDCTTPGGNQELMFKAKSTIDLDVKINQVVVDLQTSDLYFNLAISLPEDLQDGEYEYSLMKGDTILSSGLLVIGDYEKPDQHNTEIEYKQYETE